MRLVLSAALLVLISGCTVHTAGVRTRAVVEYRYSGYHPVEVHHGDGWCFIEHDHVHPYAPPPQHYVHDGGRYTYIGVTQIWYVDPHPFHGGHCHLSGRHTHDFAPHPQQFSYDRGRRGYVWQGHGRPQPAPGVVTRPPAGGRPSWSNPPSRPGGTPHFPGNDHGRPQPPHGAPPGQTGPRPGAPSHPWGGPPGQGDGKGNGNSPGKGNGVNSWGLGHNPGRPGVTPGPRGNGGLTVVFPPGQDRKDLDSNPPSPGGPRPDFQRPSGHRPGFPERSPPPAPPPVASQPREFLYDIRVPKTAAEAPPNPRAQQPSGPRPHTEPLAVKPKPPPSPTPSSVASNPSFDRSSFGGQRPQNLPQPQTSQAQPSRPGRSIQSPPPSVRPPGSPGPARGGRGAPGPGRRF